jgi:hypothetical protein
LRSVDRQRHGERSVRDAGDPPNPFNELRVKRLTAFFRPLRSRQREAGRQHVVGAEAGVNGDQLLYRADHETRPNEKHDGERRLDDDECAPYVMRTGGKPRRSTADERLLSLGAGGLKRRKSAEHESADRGRR